MISASACGRRTWRVLIGLGDDGEIGRDLEQALGIAQIVFKFNQKGQVMAVGRNWSRIAEEARTDGLEIDGDRRKIRVCTKIFCLIPASEQTPISPGIRFEGVPCSRANESLR